MPNIKIEYSQRAVKAINALKHFDKNDFDKWWIKKIQNPGSRDIWRYLLERKVISDDIDKS